MVSCCCHIKKSMKKDLSVRNSTEIFFHIRQKFSSPVEALNFSVVRTCVIR